MGKFKDHRVLNPIESVFDSLVEICMYYLNLFMKGAEAHDSFKISLVGDWMVGMEGLATVLFDLVIGLDV